MSVTLKATQPAALIPVLSSSLAQLQPVMMKTQQSIEGLSLKFTSALERSEERGRKLEAELIAIKAQQAVDKAASETRETAKDALIDTLQKTVAALEKRMSILEEGQTKYIRPAIKATIRLGGSSCQELDYPGKKEDVELRKPALQAEIAALKLTISKMLFTTQMEKNRAYKKLESLLAESARIASWEATEAKAKE